MIKRACSTAVYEKETFGFLFFCSIVRSFRIIMIADMGKSEFSVRLKFPGKDKLW